MRTTRFAGLLFSVLALLILGFATGPHAADKRISIGTGSSRGVYYLWGGALQKIVNSKVPGVELTVESTSGQYDNAQLVERGKAELAMFNTLTAEGSWSGKGKWTKGKAFRNIRGMLPMYPSKMILYAPTDQKMKTIWDYQGKHVAVGLPNGTPAIVAPDLFQALGIKPKQFHYIGWGDVNNSVRDGIIQAIVAIGGQPWPPIVDLTTTHKVTFINLRDDDYKKIFAKLPHYAKGAIAKGTYQYQDTELNTLAFWNIIAVNKDLPDDIVYKITKAISENKAIIAATHPKTAQEFDPKNITVSPLPIHPGAARYYKEIGVAVKTQ